jgi:hypothetical protein
MTFVSHSDFGFDSKKVLTEAESCFRARVKEVNPVSMLGITCGFLA